MVKAADLDANRRITAADLALLADNVARLNTIDQVTGKAS